MIEAAQLTWRDGQPYSENYEDIYHPANGPQEVKRIFIGPGGLPQLARERDRICVGELGFGTGLNFAVTAEACLREGCALHFMSFEAAPIEPREFTALARKRAADQPIYAELATHYPPLIEGWHRRYFAKGKITLSVFWGDVASGLADLTGRQRRPIELWYLDGFDPRKIRPCGNSRCSTSSLRYPRLKRALRPLPAPVTFDAVCRTPVSPCTG